MDTYIPTPEEYGSQRYSTKELIDDFKLFKLSVAYWIKKSHIMNIELNGSGEYLSPELMNEFQKECKAILAGSFMLTCLYKKHMSNDRDYFMLKKYEPIFRKNFLPKFGRYKIRRNQYTISNNRFDLYEFCIPNKRDIFNNKIQVIIVDTDIDLLEHIRKNFDITICTTCTDGERLYLSQDGEEMLLRIQSTINLESIKKRKDTLRITLGRIEKYEKKGIIVDYEELKLMIKDKCLLCTEDFTPNTEFITCCGKIVHYSCMKKWCKFKLGSIVTESKLKCPFCRKFLDHRFINRMDYSKMDFEKNIYVKCKNCGRIDILCQKSCGQDIKEMERKCSTCIQGARIVCPNCSTLLEHAGGCASFTCCIYGADECKGANCGHGGLCGHRFQLQRWQLSNRLYDSEYNSQEEVSDGELPNRELPNDLLPDYGLM